MSKEQISKLEEALLKFITDTVESATSENEILVLPEVAMVLVELEKLNR